VLPENGLCIYLSDMKYASRILLFYMAIMLTCPVLKTFGCDNLSFTIEYVCDDGQEKDECPESDCVCADCCNMDYIHPPVEHTLVDELLVEQAEVYTLRAVIGFQQDVWNPPDMG
jgi:hypothetical protein